MDKLFVNIFFAGIFTILVSCSRQSVSFIDDFENPDNAHNWTFVKDTGALGELGCKKPERGSHACLSWNLAQGGRWIGARKTFDTIPQNAKGIRLKIKCPGVSTAWLYLVDKNESIYKYRLSRSLTDLDDTQWFSKTVSFNTKPDSLINGSFSPDIAKMLKSIVVAIEPRMDPWFPKDRWFPQPKGEMWFDNVEWVTDYDEPLALANERQNSIPAVKLWQRTGVCTHFEHGDLNQPDSIKAVGFNVVRADILWNMVETKKGIYNFSFFDSLVNVAEKHNIRTLFILDYSNKLYTEKENSALLTNEQLIAYGSFCAATARFFKGRAVDFEIWNEPDVLYAWDPKPNVLQFSKLLKTGVDSVKKANPQAKVISAGTAGIDWRFINSLGKCNALQQVDGIGIHPYSKGSPESFSEDLVCLRWLAKKYFKGYPGEWATECGANSTHYGDGYSDSAQLWQARIDVRAILATWLADFKYSMKYEFFTWGTDPKDVECNYGIMSKDLKPRPSYIAIKTLKTFTENRIWAGRLNTKNSSAYALQFNGKKDKLLILWTSADKLTSDLTGYKTRFILPKKPFKIYNYLGKEIPFPTKVNNKWILEADGEIIYVLLNNSNF